MDPAPDVVTLRFSEDVSLELGGVRVLDTDGERVDKDDAQADGEIVTVGLPDDLGDGTYVVAWSVVSADSHPVNGAFTFVVGEGLAASDDEIASLLDTPDDTGWHVAAGIARFAAYAGTLLAAGGFIFISVVDRRRASRSVVRLLTGAAVVGAVGLLAQIPLQAAIATESGWSAVWSPSRWVDVMSNTAVRWSTALGLVGLVLVVIAVASADEERPSAPAWMGWFGAAVAFGSFALTGHTHASRAPRGSSCRPTRFTSPRPGSGSAASCCSPRRGCAGGARATRSPPREWWIGSLRSRPGRRPRWP